MFLSELFYYYEAMLTAAKNLSSVFTDFEGIITKNYSLGWIDFNTSVFIRYFFQTEFVQNKIYRCLEVSNFKKQLNNCKSNVKSSFNIGLLRKLLDLTFVRGLVSYQKDFCGEISIQYFRTNLLFNSHILQLFKYTPKFC